MDLSNRRLLDKAYVEEMVGERVKSYNVAAGAKQGDNIIGKMLALDVVLENEEGTTLHLVVKSLLPLNQKDLSPEILGQSGFINALQVFPTEIQIYKEVLPLLQQVTGYPYTRPKVYSSLTDGLNDYITMEDLRSDGYIMADKKKGLSLTEVKAVLREAALLHAHSYAVIQSKNPEMQELMQSSPVLNSITWQRPLFSIDQSGFFNGLLKKMVEVLREERENEAARRTERFIPIGHKIVMDLWQKTEANGKYFRVITHGDLWTNNVLFKYGKNGESVEDVKIIDFQQSHFGNIYEDLQYFIFTSTTADFRKTSLKPCLQSYFKEFSSILKELNCPLPTNFTEEEVIATFYENLEYGLCYDLIAIPFQLGEAGPPPEPQQQQPEGEQKIVGPQDVVAAMTEMLKAGTKNSPTAIQRIKELTSEMMKLNVLS